MKDSRLDELAARFNVPRELLEALTAELTPEQIAANATEHRENQGEDFELGDADSAATLQADHPPRVISEQPHPEEAPGLLDEEGKDSWQALPAGDDAPTIELTPEMIEEIDNSSHISAMIQRHDSVQRIAAEIAESSPPPAPKPHTLKGSPHVHESEGVEDSGDVLPEIPSDGEESSLGNTRSELFAGPHVLRSEQATPMIMTSEGKLFEDLGLLGMGGLGEVRKVRDISLGRSVAMKLLHEEYHHNEAIVARFIEEAQVTAQLQHPGIAPVHELGRTRDGRLYFTMKEIRGRTLRDAIEEVHEVSSRVWRVAPSGWSFRRLMETYLKICEAIAYTHKKGVVHRDLKPDNIMLGDLGEVLVVDWGLVKVAGREKQDSDAFLEQVESVRSRSNLHDTHTGAISGTPAYMAPEQANGWNEHIDHRCDIYALGCILYEILSGRPPYEGDSPAEILQRVLNGPPVPLELTQLLAKRSPVEQYTDTNITNVWATSKLPSELVDVCERAMERSLLARIDNVDEIIEVISTWREGDHNRIIAKELIDKAKEALDEEDELRERARELKAQARTKLEGLKPWDTEERKTSAWELEDLANELELKTALKGLEAEQLLNGALLYAQNNEEAHIVLVDRYKKQHQRAERSRDREAELRAEAQMITHLYALSDDHPSKRANLSYLKGDGRLTLLTEPSGVEVMAQRYEQKHRKLVLEKPSILGTTPLEEAAIPMGSYLLTLTAPGYATVRCPVFIGRQDRWESRPPGAEKTNLLRLPRAEHLEENDVFVPAGWFWAGDDRERSHAIPKQRIWLDSFVIKRFPVTNREFITFLDDMALLGRESQALEYVPRARGSLSRGEATFELTDDGFVPLVEGGLDAWEMDWPVTMITWEAANAYAQWYSMRTGVVWRLPGELEWEKAARGTDGRVYPWGDFFDPAWCCTEESHIEQAHPQVVNSYPTDVSPYGVRGLAGNALDMCLDHWRPEGPPIDDGHYKVNFTTSNESVVRVAKGSSWNRGAHLARAYHRFLVTPNLRADFLSFRLARSL
jgi:serine/threonine-protein kinase